MCLGEVAILPPPASRLFLKFWVSFPHLLSNIFSSTRLPKQSSTAFNPNSRWATWALSDGETSEPELLSRPKNASEAGNFELWNSTYAVDAPQIFGAWADEALATSSLDIFSAFGLQIPVETICRPLRDSLQYTRLLALFRTQDRQIRCCSDEVQLFEPPDHTALSYCWGSPDDTRTLFVNNTGFQVRRNLWAFALLKISRVWAEALCINQRGQPRRRHQVQLMRITYSRATGVIAWIGKSSDDSSQAIAALKRMPATTSSSARDTIWEELESLFARPYWKRIWVIQEIVVTAKISFVALTSLPRV